MNFAIDLGNTSVKCGIFEGSELIEKLEGLSIDQLIDTINGRLPKNVILSSVHQEVTAIANKIVDEVNCLIMSHHVPIPITNGYLTKDTLGLDRLAGAVGANSLFPDQHNLVVDAGTCITYDLVSKEGQYEGGAISPGVHLRFRSIHEFTARLPLVEVEEQVPLLGRSTKESILSGILHGTAAEITQMIRMYASKFADLRIIICGGDSRLLKRNLSSDVTFVPDLVLIGLNTILGYNVEGI
ncbi:type III pantothenate kinase [Fulvivirgaceae bacterium BMA12]|uniref:Type III pantothenate kinase n=1 Tax=Agaribacillus aureus TaxID=3051825 RepID=A0ABT8LIG7_9BACT|nr:type III pantothenate kinase [Fulvivirgaceae bacterium BMA12]